MSDTSGGGTERRLFINGERLRVAVDPPPSGGGTKFEPQTAAEAQAVLRPRLAAVASTAASLPTRLRGDRLYVEVRLLPNYLAASYFPDALLSQIGAEPVGSRADVGVYRTKSREQRTGTRRLVLAIDDDGLERFQDLVDQPGLGRTRRQAFEEIRKLDDVTIADEETVVLSRPSGGGARIMWEAVLHPIASGRGSPVPQDPETMEKWFALVSRLDGTSHRDYVRQVGGLTFAPVEVDPDRAGELARFNPLRSMRPMPPIRPRPIFGTRALTRLQPPPTTAPRSGAPKVAVFDGGVRRTNPQSPFLPDGSTDLTPEPEDDESLDHGTGVTAAVMYGLALPGQALDPPPAPVTSFRVLPTPIIPGDLEGYWVLDQIKDRVATDGFQLVNLSLGPALAVEDTTEPNRWTAELDQLAWERDVLFVVAAGNDGDADEATGLHRVQVPADMVNGLSIGACDVAAPSTPWSRAPYSSMGPGRHGNRTQPGAVQFGGVNNSMFPVVRSDGSFLEAAGTSFAAPLVTHALADLATRLPKSDANVLRAFAVHFAERHRHYRRLVDEVGHGRQPLSFAPHLDCAPDEAHVLFADTIERGELLGYDVPIPSGAGVPLECIITLAYASPVEPSESTEYTRASLELAMRPHDTMHRFSPPTGTTGKAEALDVTSAEALNRLANGWTMSQEPVTKTLGAPPGSSEAQLRDSGKWETVRHHRVRFAAGEVQNPRIEVGYIARRGGGLDGDATEVPFALLITVRDRAASGDLHDRIAAEYPVLVQVPRSVARVRGRRAEVRRR